MHLSFMIERSHCGEDEPCAEVIEVRRVGTKWSSFGAKGNSTILSIRGALTETSRELRHSRKPVLFRHAESSIMAFFSSGRDALLVVGPDCFTEVLESESCTVSRPFESSVRFLGAEEVFDEANLRFLAEMEALEEIFLLTGGSSHVLPIDSLPILRCK